MSTVYGTGTDLVDYKEIESHVYSVMRWATLFWIPIFPLQQLAIRAGRRNDWGGGKFGTRYDYVVLDQQPLERGRVVQQYVHSASGLLAAILPLTAWIVLCRPGAGVPQTEPMKLFGLASVLWIAAVVQYFRLRTARLYQSLNLPTRFD